MCVVFSSSLALRTLVCAWNTRTDTHRTACATRDHGAETAASELPTIALSVSHSPSQAAAPLGITAAGAAAHTNIHTQLSSSRPRCAHRLRYARIPAPVPPARTGRPRGLANAGHKEEGDEEGSGGVLPPILTRINRRNPPPPPPRRPPAAAAAAAAWARG